VEPAVIREATAADIDRIDSIALEEFATDFSRLPFPERPGRLSPAEMLGLVESFVDTLQVP